MRGDAQTGIRGDVETSCMREDIRDRERKEIVGIGVSIKEELIEDVTEDTCLEIKEEPLDYGDETRNGVCNVNVIHESHFCHNLHDLRPEAHAKDSCNLVQDCNDMSKVQFGAKDCGKTWKVESTRKCFACEVCGKEVSQKSHINFHMGFHTMEMPYNCEICNKTFPSKSDLEKHVDVHTEGKLYNCEICSKVFSYEPSFFNHMLMHTVEKPYSYEICNKVISQKHNLVKNMRVHTKKKSYSCDTCSKTFSERRGLVKHIRVHKEEKPYNCEICNNTFLWKYNLPHSCEICKKAFSKRSHLVMHIRVHTKERPYNCEICSNTFAWKNNLVRHMKIHTVDKPYSCEICNKAFSEKGHLVKHTRVHTKKPYNCKICNKYFFGQTHVIDQGSQQLLLVIAFKETAPLPLNMVNGSYPFFSFKQDSELSTRAITHPTQYCHYPYHSIFLPPSSSYCFHHYRPFEYPFCPSQGDQFFVIPPTALHSDKRTVSISPNNCPVYNKDLSDCEKNLFACLIDWQVQCYPIPPRGQCKSYTSLPRLVSVDMTAPMIAALYVSNLVMTI
ncbi:zinc finger protein 383-like [Penaeus monodon]|uniref:zinc finger protein 383-like n=1 Tax=Penaeus monodon TaxID=6687 RepID=UPI0018A7DACB|nr:zinc finger protein 383-like [Penaeus monodon]